MEFNGKWGLVMILGLGYLYLGSYSEKAGKCYEPTREMGKLMV